MYKQLFDVALGAGWPLSKRLVMGTSFGLGPALDFSLVEETVAGETYESAQGALAFSVEFETVGRCTVVRSRLENGADSVSPPIDILSHWCWR